MNIDFLLLLLIATLFTGLVSLSYWVLAREPLAKAPAIINHCYSLFPIFLIVLLIKSFLVQLNFVPTGSLEPTILPGELLIANQFQYGLHLPVWRHTLLSFNHAERGQIVLFYDPVNPKVILIKRLIGLPGDKISYINKTLYINGKRMMQTYLGQGIDSESDGRNIAVNKYEEDLNGIKHNILINPNIPGEDFYNLTVPNNEYFAMGDNRDNSDDSRYWGFVPYDNLIGKGMVILLSWDRQADTWYPKIRWNRTGTIL